MPGESLGEAAGASSNKARPQVLQGPVARPLLFIVNNSLFKCLYIIKFGFRTISFIKILGTARSSLLALSQLKALRLPEG